MSLYELNHEPVLDRPVLIVSLEGWIDAGLGAAGATAALMSEVETELVATFDTDALLDHRARRPVVRIVDGVNTALTWPQLELRAGNDSAGNDVMLLVGPEPDHQWKGFSAAVGELATRLGVRMMVGLGAFPAPVPHTRVAGLASTASDEKLAEAVGFVPGTLDVPAGAEAALEEAFSLLGTPAIGLWARVPHYVAAMPYPEASVQLLDGLREVAGITCDTAELRATAVTARERLDELVANSEQHQALVHQLEAQFDAEASDPMRMTSGDDLAAELERFLRGEST